MDGAAKITQEPIGRGQVYRYEFTAVQSGAFLYHSHDHVDRQQALGLNGALIVDPRTPDPSLQADHEYVIELQEWLKREGLTYPAMPMDGGQPNYFTINGKAYPATDVIPMRVGRTLKVRFVGSNNGFIHPMHIHGGPFVVVARDGETLPPAGRYKADAINVGPGQRYDVIWTALKPGKWLIHCHIGHHTTNNNVEMQGGGGLMTVIDAPGRERWPGGAGSEREEPACQDGDGRPRQPSSLAISPSATSTFSIASRAGMQQPEATVLPSPTWLRQATSPSGRG